MRARRRRARRPRAARERWLQTLRGGSPSQGMCDPAKPPGHPGRDVDWLTLRLIVARCEVRYSGRLTAVLPEALRLLMVKADGSVMVHSDAGGYKPENWMTPPTVIEESPERIVVRKGKDDDPLDIPHHQG